MSKSSHDQHDGAADNVTVSETDSVKASGSTSWLPPSPPAEEPRLVPVVVSPGISRSSSPSIGSGYESLAASSASFGYPYHQSLQTGFFAEKFAPTAIHG